MASLLAGSVLLFSSVPSKLFEVLDRSRPVLHHRGFFSKAEEETLEALIDVLFPPRKSFVGGRACGLVGYFSHLFHRFSEEAKSDLCLKGLRKLRELGFVGMSAGEREKLIASILKSKKKGEAGLSEFLRQIREQGFEGIWYWPYVEKMGGDTGLTLLKYEGPKAAVRPPFGYYDATLPILNYQYDNF